MAEIPRESITLQYPIEVDGVEYTELNMRRLKVRDQLAAKKVKGDDAVQEVHLFANLCEVKPDVIEALDIKDYRAIQEVFRTFLE